jgi:hypothetical protein
MGIERSAAFQDRGATTPGRSSGGLSFLLPGFPQWAARQRERGLVLFATYASSLSIGIFTWGSRTSLALIAFAYVTHIASATDAIHQWSFPGFGRWVPAFYTTTGLAVVGYGPLVLMGFLLAWPGIEGDSSGDSYLVNRLAYEDRAPEPGEYVWLAGSGIGGHEGLGQVLAGPGEDVEWVDGRLRIAGRYVNTNPFRPGLAPKQLDFKVPEDRYLVSYKTGDPVAPHGWDMVPKDRFEGRAWAKHYPVWERRLLP